MGNIKFKVWDKKNEKWLNPDTLIITNYGIYEDSRDFEDGIGLEENEYVFFYEQ